MYQNIADTEVEASAAAASIVSQIQAFGRDMIEPMHIIDAYNEVANNFAVGTNDLSRALELSAAGMATYGNTFEETIGLVTAGTEIMVGRSAQVARGLNTISANIVANSDVLAKYGIQVKGANGELKATYDVLAELKPVWDSLTDVERQALGQTLAGKNQYRVLASIMQNFEHAVEATTTALNSEGSAMQENEAYMESLEARTNLIKADFQTLANHVINSQLVKSILALTDACIKLADTGLGRILLQLTLLGGIGWGASHLIQASKILGVFKADLFSLGSAVLTLTGQTNVLTVAQTAQATASKISASASTTDAEKKLAQATATMLADKATKAMIISVLQLVGLLAAGAVVIYGTVKALQWMDDSYQKHVKTLKELNEEYDQVYGTGSEYDQLKEKVGQLTIEERNRLVELEAEKAVLEEQIKAEEKITYEKWRQNQYQYDSSVRGQYKDTLASSLDEYDTLNSKLESGVITTEEYYTSLQKFAGGLKATVDQIRQGKEAGAELDATAQNALDTYDAIILMLGDYFDAQTNATDITEEQVSVIQTLVEKLNDLQDVLSATQSAYDDFNEDGEISYSTIASLSEKFAELGDDALQGYIRRLTDANLTSDDFQSIMSEMTLALMENRIETMGLTKDDQRLVEMMLEEVGVTNSAEIAAYLLRDAEDSVATATDNATGAVQDFNAQPVNNSGKIAAIEGITRAFSNLQKKILDTHIQLNNFLATDSLWTKRTEGTYDAYLVDTATPTVIQSGTGESGGRGGGGGSRSSTEKVKTQLEQWEDDLKTIENHYSNILSLTESEYSLLVDQGASSEDIIAKAQEYQNLLHEENEALREFLAQIPNIPENQDLINEIQTKINKNSSTWWDWAKKINDEYEKIAKAAQDAAEEAEKVIKSLADAWDDEIEQQKEALLALQSQMEDYYSGLIDDIDKQIEALNAANDALDQQITYEEKLDAIAKARQSKAMVYKDGRWQYVEDIDAVSTAVKEFEDFTRERNLKEQIDALEREKDALENMKNAWSNFTKSYENDMDKWLINQKLGIDTSLAEWQKWIDGIGAYMTQYSNLMNATNPYGTTQYKTATGGTKGYGTTTTAGGEVYYTSDKAIKFIENAKSGTLMTDTADGSTWYKESDTKTVITAADGTTSAVIDLSNPNTSVVSSGSTSSSKSTSHSKEGAKYSLSKHANGTLSALGGLSLVGEHGAELRVLNQGDGIIPADLTQNLMLWGRVNPIQYASQYVGDKLNSAMNVTIQALNLPSVTNGQEFVDYIRNNLFGQVLSYVH